MDFICACAAIKWHQQSVADDMYRSDPHARIHRVLASSVNQFQCWQRDWIRDQCVMVAQLHTGHSLLLAGCLHHMGRRVSATCLHCSDADKTAAHLVLQCPAHDQVRRTSRQEENSTWILDDYMGLPRTDRGGDPLRPPPPDREWERERLARCEFAAAASAVASPSERI